VPRWALHAGPLYRLAVDPDGRPRRVRKAGGF
jgi:hypothetical protein